MVGVAGKSKACENCKARRVKCDLDRPGCKRCQRAGRVCLGYTKAPAIFIDRTLTNPSTTVTDVITAAKCEKTQSPEEAVGPAVEYVALRHAFESPPYSVLGFRARALRISRRLYMPRHKAMEGPVSPGDALWLESVCRIAHPSPTLDISDEDLAAKERNVPRWSLCTRDRTGQEH